MMSFWWILNWFNNSLWKSGCLLMYFPVRALSTSAWCWRSSLPGWSPWNCGARLEFTLPTNLAREWQARRLSQSRSSSPVEWQREPWNGDCLLPLWSGKDGAFDHASDPCPAGLTSASHSGDEDLHQLALFPSEVFWPPLPGCSHPARECLNHLMYPMPYALFLASCNMGSPMFLLLFLDLTFPSLRLPSCSLGSLSCLLTPGVL